MEGETRKIQSTRISLGIITFPSTKWEIVSALRRLEQAEANGTRSVNVALTIGCTLNMQTEALRRILEKNLTALHHRSISGTRDIN